MAVGWGWVLSYLAYLCRLSTVFCVFLPAYGITIFKVAVLVDRFRHEFSGTNLSTFRCVTKDESPWFEMFRVVPRWKWFTTVNRWWDVGIMFFGAGVATAGGAVAARLGVEAYCAGFVSYWGPLRLDHGVEGVNGWVQIISPSRGLDGSNLPLSTFSQQYKSPRYPRPNTRDWRHRRQLRRYPGFHLAVLLLWWNR